jgi:hypothetical protein
MIGNPNPPAATAPPLNGNSPAPATRTPTNRISFRHGGLLLRPKPLALSRPIIAYRYNLRPLCTSIAARHGVSLRVAAVFDVVAVF